MLTRMVSISWPHDPPASASQSAGITGVSHRAQPGLHSWFGSQLGRYWCTEKLLIFLHWFCIMKVCWSCLLDLEGFIDSYLLWKETIWLPVFTFGCLLFISLAWLLWLGFLVLCWIEMVRMCIFVLFWFSREMLSAFAHSVQCWLWICHRWLLLF